MTTTDGSPQTPAYQMAPATETHPEPTPNAPGRILLLRHGQTDWNIDRRFQGNTDIPLNNTGREQIRAALPELQNLAATGVSIDGVVSSPLSRAIESAQIVAEGLNVPYLGAYEGLQERYFGELEGKVATPELVVAARSGKIPTVEPRGEFVARAVTALNRIRTEHPGKNIVVATHGMLIAVTMTALLKNERPEQLNEEGMYPIPTNGTLTQVPLELLDAAIDRYVIIHTQPDLKPEPAPKNLGSLTLVRHGQTDWNKGGLMQGISNIPLNDTGREQARNTAQKLVEAGLEFDVLLASPLSRAYETAQLLGERLNLPVAGTYPDLVERHYGMGEGVNFPLSQRCNPERYWPGAESERDLYIRAARVLRQMVREHPGQRIIAVSHGSLIRRALSAASGKEHTEPVPNAQPVEIDIAGLFAWDSTAQFGARQVPSAELAGSGLTQDELKAAKLSSAQLLAQTQADYGTVR